MKSEKGMNRLIVKQAGNITFITQDEIDWIEADRNNVRVRCGERSFHFRQSLGNIEKKLSGGEFVRVNRSVIVNVGRIRELQALAPGRTAVVLDEDHCWNWGRQFRKNLRTLLERQVQL